MTHVGKETNKLEEVEAGLEHDPEMVYTAYRDPARHPWRTQVLPGLRQLPQAELAEAVGMSVRRLRDLLTGKVKPRRETQEVLTGIAEQRYTKCQLTRT